MSKTISKAIKKKLWDNYFGTDCGKIKCPINCGSYITQLEFEVGHQISKYNGGGDDINNLIPICRLCNGSMGKKNLCEYINEYKISLCIDYVVMPVKIPRNSDTKDLPQNVHIHKYTKEPKINTRQNDEMIKNMSYKQLYQLYSIMNNKKITNKKDYMIEALQKCDNIDELIGDINYTSKYWGKCDVCDIFIYANKLSEKCNVCQNQRIQYDENVFRSKKLNC